MGELRAIPMPMMPMPTSIMLTLIINSMTFRRIRSPGRFGRNNKKCRICSKKKV